MEKMKNGNNNKMILLKLNKNKMKRFRIFLSHILIAIILLSLLGCSKENTLSDTKTYSRQYQLKLNCSLIDYDANTRATRTEEWENNSHIYISFISSGKRIIGSAIYNVSNDLWTLSTDEEIPLGTIGECEVYYFNGEQTLQDGIVRILDQTAVYADLGGNFKQTQDLIIIKANLTPVTGRIRFMGDKGSIFRITGINTYCSYNQLSNELSTEYSTHLLEIGEDGFSPYLYAGFPKGTNRLFLTMGTSSFSKTCSSNVLIQGKSGVMALPTKENHEGWDMMELSLPKISSFDLSEITDVSVYAHAYVSNIGDWQLIDAGFVYSQNNSSPTVTDNKVSFGYSNSISGNINELKAETSYYIRAYAVNSKGISYSETKQFTTNSDPRIWDGKSVAKKFGGGNGSENNPILIYTAAQLKLLANNVEEQITDYENVYFKLMADIDLNNYEWNPIGTVGHLRPFRGTFDGGGHQIKNINAVLEDASNPIEGNGLFAYITDGCIRNLAISGIVHMGNNSSTGAFGNGIGNAKIENCVSYCTMENGGGILGGSAHFRNCVNYGNGAAAGISPEKIYSTLDNCYWIYDIASNIGNKYSALTANIEGTGSSFAFGEKACLISPDYKEDLLQKLNNWVYMHDGEIHYNKWEYKKIDGKYTVFLIPD